LYIYYKHIQSRLSEDDYKLLIDTLSVKVLADLPLSTSLDTFEDTLAALYSEESDRKFNKRLKGLQTLYNVCIEKDHCSKNTISLILHFAKSLNNRRHQVNAALKKNSLVTKEFQKAFNWAKHNAKRHPKYLGILIMLLTGIRSNEVCALRWCDLYENRYGFYSFLIYHEYKNNKMEAIDANRIRRVPCISLLSSVLLAHRPPNTEHYSENFILEKDEKCITPEMLSAAAKELIEYLKINTEILVTLAPNSKNFDLSSFRAVDLIRNNFRYWFSTLCKGNVSECAYVLGVHNPLTVGRHYIDYASEEVQYIIYKKLQRLVPDLLNLHNCWDTFTFLIDNANNYTIESKGSGPSNCTLRLKALEPSTKITVTAPHGFNFVVTNIINIERK